MFCNRFCIIKKTLRQNLCQSPKNIFNKEVRPKPVGIVSGCALIIIGNVMLLGVRLFTARFHRVVVRLARRACCRGV